MKNRGSTLILTHLVGTFTHNLRQICAVVQEKNSKNKKIHADDDDDDDDDNDGHSLIARVTLTHWVWLKSKKVHNVDNDDSNDNKKDMYILPHRVWITI